MCDVTRFLGDKHDRSSRQLGLRESLILIVYQVSYEAHNYNSVGREMCTKTAVCFDQFNLPSLPLLLSERGENCVSGCCWYEIK